MSKFPILNLINFFNSLCYKPSININLSIEIFYKRFHLYKRNPSCRVLCESDKPATYKMGHINGKIGGHFYRGGERGWWGFNSHFYHITSINL